MSILTKSKISKILSNYVNENMNLPSDCDKTFIVIKNFSGDKNTINEFLDKWNDVVNEYSSLYSVNAKYDGENITVSVEVYSCTDTFDTDTYDDDETPMGIGKIKE